MPIKTAPSPDHIDVEQFLQTLLAVCGFMSIGNKNWQAAKYDDSKKIEGREVKAVGVRFHRIKARYVPKTWFGKLIQRMADAIEPAVEIEPLYVHARHHRIVTRFVVGRWKFSGPCDSVFQFPFREEFRQIQGAIKKLDPMGPKDVS